MICRTFSQYSCTRGKSHHHRHHHHHHHREQFCHRQARLVFDVIYPGFNVKYQGGKWRVILNTEVQLTLVMYPQTLYTPYLPVQTTYPYRPSLKTRSFHSIPSHFIAQSFKVTKHPTQSPVGPLFPLPFHTFHCVPIGRLRRTNRCRDLSSCLSVALTLWVLWVIW